MSQNAFPKAYRLLTSQDFSNIFNDAPIRAPHSQLLILAKPNQLPHARLGLVIAKKNIRLATQRNRIKRIIRDHFRLKQTELMGMDIVVLARRGLDQLPQPQIHKLVSRQLIKLSERFKKQQKEMV